MRQKKEKKKKSLLVATATKEQLYLAALTSCGGESSGGGLQQGTGSRSASRSLLHHIRADSLHRLASVAGERRPAPMAGEGIPSTGAAAGSSHARVLCLSPGGVLPATTACAVRVSLSVCL